MDNDNGICIRTQASRIKISSPASDDFAICASTFLPKEIPTLILIK